MKTLWCIDLKSFFFIFIGNVQIKYIQNKINTTQKIMYTDN